MKKIKLDSCLELEKYPELIKNINRLIINKSIHIDLIDEYRKYLSEAVVEKRVNSNNEYIISLDEIKIISAIYTFGNSSIENMLETLVIEELLISNLDGTYSFNEEIYDKVLVEYEKKRIIQSSKYPLKYIKSPWRFVEHEEYYSLEGYCDVIQDFDDVASACKLDDGDDEFRKEGLEDLIYVPNYFEFLIRSVDYIDDKNLKEQVEDILNSILNFEPKCVMISSGDEYDEYLNNKTDNNLEILDISDWIEVFGAVDIVDKCDSVANMFIDDANMGEKYGCMSLIMHHVKLSCLFLDVANKLPKDSDIYIEIIEFFGEDYIKEWLE